MHAAADFFAEPDPCDNGKQCSRNNGTAGENDCGPGYIQALFQIISGQQLNADAENGQLQDEDQSAGKNRRRELAAQECIEHDKPGRDCNQRKHHMRIPDGFWKFIGHDSDVGSHCCCIEQDSQIYAQAAVTYFS